VKILAKIVLAMDGDAIAISTDKIWKSISMMGRIEFKLPSILNALELFHGSENEETSRRNDFVPWVVSVATMII
jgi:hypothetical protein